MGGYFCCVSVTTYLPLFSYFARVVRRGIPDLVDFSAVIQNFFCCVGSKSPANLLQERITAPFLTHMRRFVSASASAFSCFLCLESLVGSYQPIGLTFPFFLSKLYYNHLSMSIFFVKIYCIFIGCVPIFTFQLGSDILCLIQSKTSSETELFYEKTVVTISGPSSGFEPVWLRAAHAG